MSASAAIADPLLRRAFGWPITDPHRTAQVRIGSSGLRALVFARTPPDSSALLHRIKPGRPLDSAIDSDIRAKLSLDKELLRELFMNP